MPEDYFSEDVAARYDDTLGRWGNPDVVGPTASSWRPDCPRCEAAAGETYVTADASPEHYCIDEYDIANQGLVSHHFWPGDGRTLSIPFRYVWPSELDLMARIAGMRPRERWSGWRGEPFTGESGKIVGVWEKAG